MKEIKCYECGEAFTSETKEDILNTLYAHYMEKHTDVIPKASGEEKKAWMLRFEKDWAEADEK